MTMRETEHRVYEYKTTEEGPLRLVFWPPKQASGPVPLVYVIHGGGWCAGDHMEDAEAFVSLVQPLMAEGWAVASVEYRLTGPEKTVRFDDLFGDVLDGLCWLADREEELHIDPRRVVAAGGSAGGHLSLMAGLAAREFLPRCPFTVRLVVDLCGPADLLDFSGYEDSEYLDDGKNLLQMLLGMPPIVPKTAAFRRASPYYYLNPQSPALYLIHGTVDTLVPFGQSKKLADRALELGVPVCLSPITYAWHDFQSRIDGKTAQPTIQTAMRAAAEWARHFCTE